MPEQDPTYRQDSLTGQLERYNDGLFELALQHTNVLKNVAPNHIALLETTSDIEESLNIPVRQVEQTTTHTFGNLGRYLNDANGSFLGTIKRNPESLKVWTEMDRLIRIYGLQDYRVDDIFDNLKGIELGSAMRAALDKNVWEKAQHNARIFGVDAYRVEDTIMLASSSAATAAMRAALDKNVWEKAQHNARIFGLNNERVAKTIYCASDNRVASVFIQLIYKKFNQREGAANSHTFRDSDPFAGYTRRRSANGHQQNHTKNQQTPPFTKVPPAAEKPPRDHRIDTLKGKDISAPDKPVVTLLANLDHHREKGKSDQQIYRLLIRHFHPDRKHPDAEVMIRVITKAYDSGNKSFLV